MTVGNRITKRRTVQKISLNKLAEAAGCSKGYLHQLENSDIIPGSMVLYKIAVALGTTMEALLGVPALSDGDAGAMNAANARELMMLRRRLARIARLATLDRLPEEVKGE